MYEIIYNFKSIFSKLFLSLILILAIISVNILANESYRSAYILYYSILLCISSDIGGYVFGKIIKGRKLTKISPNKTFSGFFGAYIFSFLALFIFNTYVLEKINDLLNVTVLFNFNEILLTFILSSVSQLGDLTISFLKRKDKIKDSGKILPGHGGILDRLDSLMFVVIAAFFFYKSFNYFL
tara:strand:- start:2022 stop:2567 length:546 start_codon:yes stop_codon:yes gene_type:complete